MEKKNNVELIIYLEPSLEFTQVVENYLSEIEQKYGSTTANKYGCHISMTGFFNTEEDVIEEITRFLSNNIDSRSEEYNVPPEINLNTIIVNEKLTNIPKHLLIPVKAPQKYHHLMESLSNIVTLRLKRIDHISLAYWDEPQATIDQENNWKEKVNKGVFEKMKRDADIYFKDLVDPVGWDIVLYKRVYKGVLVGQRHEFIELTRWPSSTTV